LAGPFLLAAVAYAAAALVLGLLLRPDPLLRARELAIAELARTASDPAPPLVVAARASVPVGAAIMVLTQLVMVAVMTMTPVHLAGHGHGVEVTGLVIGVHVAAMFLPSPLSGWLVDRFGPIPVAVAAGATLLAAGVLAATAPVDSVPLLTLALALLGLGWNFGLVSGTAILAAVPLAVRARTQGKVDVTIALAGAGGGLASGIVVAAAGYPALSLLGGVLALLILPIVAFSRVRPRRATT
jgi:MFS family permease